MNRGTEQQILTLEQIAKVEARALQVKELVGVGQFGEDMLALCHTVRALQAERLEVQRALASSVLHDPSEDDDPPYSTTELVNGIHGLITMKQSLLTRYVELKRRLKEVEKERNSLRGQVVGLNTKMDDFRTRVINLCKEKAIEYAHCQGNYTVAALNELREAIEKESSE